MQGFGRLRGEEKAALFAFAAMAAATVLAAVALSALFVRWAVAG